MQPPVLKKPEELLLKIHRKQDIQPEILAKFKQLLHNFLTLIDSPAREGKQENDLRDFLNDAFYKGKNYINKKETIDWAIHNGKEGNSSVGVLIEVKRTSAKIEMMTESEPNSKALHELVLYYLRERIEHNNHEIKHLIVTNCYDWYIFDELWFNKYIYTPKFIKTYKDWKLSKHSTDDFYKIHVKTYLDNLEKPLEFCKINLKDYAKTTDKNLTTLYKILSPEHLLKQEIANDANKLNRPFYNELLYIIGVEERKDEKSNKKIITRLKESNRNEGSLLENTIDKLESKDALSKIENLEAYGDNKEEQQYSIALELCITWLNRLLFLKLLEGQLVKYHTSPDSNTPNYKFLTSLKIADYDELAELFFDVLANHPTNRKASVGKKFGDIPYLNSSLFEESHLEKNVMSLETLKDRLEMPFFNNTILQDGNNKVRTGSVKTLKYLLDFLDSYDFGSKDEKEIKIKAIHHDRTINAAVLGLIFEKLNGYKDGSFFTPSFITMYMCRETIRRSVIQKFNENQNWNCQTFEDLKEQIDDYKKPEKRKIYNQIINAIKICDPAVGSGHFLVSALNEIITIKAELKILQHPNGERLTAYEISVQNDELIVWDEEAGHDFKYLIGTSGMAKPTVQITQETLFEEKRIIIENCLFGVDINPKSVSICQLRLWIELLKNAYYTKSSQYKYLETLPNIDINIKEGNSLVNRFGLRSLSASTKQLDKRTELYHNFKSYKENVWFYKETNEKALKRQANEEIKRLKRAFQGVANTKDEDYLKLKSKENALESARLDYVKKNYSSVLLYKKETDAEYDELLRIRMQTIADETVVLSKKWEQKLRFFYGNAFEWAYEFPEIIDDDSQFIGFDIVIGNPPYIRQEDLAQYKTYFKQNFGQTHTGTADLCIFFVEQARNILRKGGQFSFILPNKWMRAGYGSGLRAMLRTVKVNEIVDFGDLPVFEEAAAYPCILSFETSQLNGEKLDFNVTNVEKLDFENGLSDYVQKNHFQISMYKLDNESWNLTNPVEQKLLEKIIKNAQPLKDYLNEIESYYGIKTGLSEAFIIDNETRQKLIDGDVNSENIIQPFLLGRDIKKYNFAKPDKHLILFGKGFTKKQKPEAENAEDWMSKQYPAIFEYLYQFKEKAIARTDKGDFWWELRACDYYPVFKKPKIMYQAFQVTPCFIYDEQGLYCNNSMWVIPSEDKYLFGLLNSSMGWYLISQYCTAIQNGYQLIYKYLSQIPIIRPNEQQHKAVTDLVDEILMLKKEDSKANITELEESIEELIFQIYKLEDSEKSIVREK